MSGRALLLTPSCGRGGGIERYAETLEWAFAAQGVECCRIDLRGTGPAAHARMLSECRRQLQRSEVPPRLVVMHRALLPVASLLASERSQRGISLVCHGIDVWGSRMRPRRVVENFLMRGRSVRVIAVSTFTAGALFGACSATVLPPGLSQEWFSMLAGAADDSRPTKPTNPGLHLLTAFRLEDWKDKGLPQLLAAIAALGRPDAHLTICGNGEPPSDLRRLIRDHQGCTLRSGLSDRELADELAGADLFVLATRTRRGRTAYGEGFGLVLLEAQVAGTAVIAPAHGGSRDAYIDGMTGVAPVDESAEALTQVLSDLLRDQQRVIQMGQRAAEWARESFAPERYASLAVARLL